MFFCVRSKMGGPQGDAAAAGRGVAVVTSGRRSAICSTAPPEPAMKRLGGGTG